MLQQWVVVVVSALAYVFKYDILWNDLLIFSQHSAV